MKHIKLTIQSKKKQATDKQNLNIDGIVPFTEQPRMEPTAGRQRRVGAHDLFSLFTANIIKEKTLFTR
jgi:hypothetical protein